MKRDASPVLRSAAALALALALAVAVGGCGPPEMGPDPEAFRAVDALYTAVSLRDPALLDQCAGSLAELHASGGDLGQPGSVCLATAHSPESVSTPSEPAPGQAFYYVVRVSPDWPAPVTWEPAPAAPGALAQRDASTTPCD